MADLFLDILNTSVAASWVVLAVIAARLVLKKAPQWMVCALWVLVAARLLWPGTIEAPFSLIPSREIIPPQSLYDPAPVIDSGVAFIDNAVNPVYTESLRPIVGASVNPLQIWLAVFANLWVLGMVVMAFWAVFSCHRVRRQLRERLRLEGNVYLCDRVESPFIFGLMRPIICLPSHLDEESRAHVLAHEKAHIARRDHWWKPLGFALLTVNWFNPLMWVGYILLCRDIEMACDERVARNMDVAEKKAYSTALLQCSIRHRYVTVCPLAFGEVGVKQRIKSVLNYKKPAFWVILMTAVLIIVLAAGLLTDPVKAAKVDDPIIYCTVKDQDCVLNCCIPENWVWVELTPTESHMGLRCRPASRKTLMEIRYYRTEDSLYGFLPGTQTEPITLPSGIRGTLYHTGNPDRWYRIVLETNQGQLYIDLFSDTTDWTDDEYRMALSIASTLSVSSYGTNVMIPSNPLGITLSLQNLTANGATLVCTQDGTLWTEIITGSQWHLERWTGEGWVSMMPKCTFWTTEAYVVKQNGTTQWNINWSQLTGTLEPGHYRLSKHFTGRLRPPVTLGLQVEEVDQTCYAEFDIG